MPPVLRAGLVADRGMIRVGAGEAGREHFPDSRTNGSIGST
jgi:hypothetical protein